MFRLAAMLYFIIAPSLAGTGVIIVLVAGAGAMPSIFIAAAVGAVLAVPVSYVIAKKLFKANVGQR